MALGEEKAIKLAAPHLACNRLPAVYFELHALLREGLAIDRIGGPHEINLFSRGPIDDIGWQIQRGPTHASLAGADLLGALDGLFTHLWLCANFLLAHRMDAARIG